MSRLDASGGGKGGGGGDNGGNGGNGGNSTDGKPALQLQYEELVRKLIDSEQKRAELLAKDDEFKFKLGQGQVIKCWDLGFASMKVGEKAVLTCGSEYAYGKSGSPPKIPADATLKFDVELLGFNPAAAPAEKKEEL